MYNKVSTSIDQESNQLQEDGSCKKPVQKSSGFEGGGTSTQFDRGSSSRDGGWAGGWWSEWWWWWWNTRTGRSLPHGCTTQIHDHQKPTQICKFINLNILVIYMHRLECTFDNRTWFYPSIIHWDCLKLQYACKLNAWNFKCVKISRNAVKSTWHYIQYFYSIHMYRLVLNIKTIWCSYNIQVLNKTCWYRCFTAALWQFSVQLISKTSQCSMWLFSTQWLRRPFTKYFIGFSFIHLLFHFHSVFIIRLCMEIFLVKITNNSGIEIIQWIQFVLLGSSTFAQVISFHMYADSISFNLAVLKWCVGYLNTLPKCQQSINILNRIKYNHYQWQFREMWYYMIEQMLMGH